ncbi:DUF6286 domain-containing protein [Kibdelosporangium phytohabitans]|uniref:DUF6286 domain-containing protein n=1 Tax=Kibdelosporangium phytohabitans TaxID=860235 RepID=A0A0N9HNT2_9PSEU|nr:DUF6286 domain-containing protein [Kibdelosporangium phytohabitans]ALG06044.1 hypothetical protein AOZ06_03135 [Kibdelosporangium phytohabitans]MBE1465879.1 hypothetical protein [Kibdelosporangium phytohabitans]
MIRRPRRGIPAVLTAVVLLGVCVVVAVSVVQLLLDEPPLISYDAVAGRIHQAQWTDLVPAIAGGVVALVGLLLVLSAVVPGKSRILVLTPDGSTTDAAISRTSLRTTLRDAAKVDGVTNAVVTVRRGRVRTVVRTDRTITDGLADAVRAAVEQRLGHIGLARHHDVTVKVKAPRSTP